MCKKLLTLGILITMPLSAMAENLAAVSINSSDQSIAWRSVNPTNSSQVTVSPGFGSNGDIALFGPFVTAGADHFGVVTATLEKKNNWRLIDSSGNLVDEREFGTTANKILAGADIDNNGVIDPIFLGKTGSSLRWRVALNLFGGGDGTITSRKHGDYAEASQAFFANLYGDGDWLGIIRRLPNNTHYQVQLRKLTTGQLRQINVLKNGAAGESVFGVADNSGNDLLTFVRNITGEKTRLRFINSTGQLVASHIFDLQGTIVKGDYDVTDPGEEVGIQSGSTILTYNPFSDATNTFTVSSNILVDRINIGKLNATASCGCELLDETDGAKIGFVYKRLSDTYGGIVAVVANPWGSQATGMVTLDTECNPIRTLYDNGYGNPDATGNRRHFKEQIATYSGTWYRNNYGSIYLKILGTNKCYFIQDPSQERID
jgi:hypothetical protein